ncbi:MAG: DUF2156 domain-containing protein [Bacteroidota bacterium]
MTDEALVWKYGWNAASAQALNPTLSRWRDGNGLVAYAEGRRWPGGPRVRIAVGDPLSAPQRHIDIAHAFAAHAVRSGADVAWFGACETFRNKWEGDALVVGAQPIWDPGRWTQILARKASLRAQVNRARNKGVTVETIGLSGTGELDSVRRAWLSKRGLPPLHFMAETSVLQRPGLRSFLAARLAKQVVGYLTLLPIPARRGVFVEWIIQHPDAPNGTAALLLDAAFRQSTEADMVTLGMVPLSSFAPLSRTPPSRYVRALLAWMRAHARRFYNFEGLERFKAKFQPDAWEPLYLLAPQRIGLGLLHAVADVFAGPRTPEELIARALADAAREEIGTARSRLLD